LKGKKEKGVEVGRARLASVVRQIRGREGVVAGCVRIWGATILFLCREEFRVRVFFFVFLSF
jgi:hypothetical protein